MEIFLSHLSSWFLRKIFLELNTMLLLMHALCSYNLFWDLEEIFLNVEKNWAPNNSILSYHSSWSMPLVVQIQIMWFFMFFDIPLWKALLNSTWMDPLLVILVMLVLKAFREMLEVIGFMVFLNLVQSFYIIGGTFNCLKRSLIDLGSWL